MSKSAVKQRFIFFLGYLSVSFEVRKSMRHEKYLDFRLWYIGYVLKSGKEQKEIDEKVIAQDEEV